LTVRLRHAIFCQAAGQSGNVGSRIADMKKPLMKVSRVIKALSFLMISLVAQHAAEEIPVINQAAVDLSR